MTKTNIKFDKRKLESLKFSGKGKFYYAENFERLALYIGKKKKTIKNKHDLEQNFRGRKGFNDTGIALTEKTIKQQRKNKLAYGKTRYASSRLNIINDARAEDARLKRLENPKHKRRAATAASPRRELAMLQHCRRYPW